jgi:hypothetical protein
LEVDTLHRHPQIYCNHLKVLLYDEKIIATIQKGINNMFSRIKNALNYGYKGALYFAPVGTITSGLMIGIFYTTKYIIYRNQRYDELKSNDYNCSPDDITCRLHYETADDWLSAIVPMADTYGTTQATAELQAIWPALVIPCMTAGMVAGAIYGFCLPIKDSPIFTEFSDDESPDCLEAYKDQIFDHRMRDPYALNCGGGHNLEYNTLLQLQPNKDSILCCPFCRGPITKPCPNKELREAIEKYVSNKKKKNKEAIKIPIETTVLLEVKLCLKALEIKATNDSPVENTDTIESMVLDNNEENENYIEVLIDDSIERPNTNNQVESYPGLADFSLFAFKKALKQPECEKTLTDRSQLAYDH